MKDIGTGKEMTTEKNVHCKYCDQEITTRAKVCHHCGKYKSYLFQFIMPSTAVVMMIVAFVQCVMAWLQYDESKRKRIEADAVLMEARHVFSIASTNSVSIKKEALKVLANSKKISQNAIVESNKALQISNKVSETAMDISRKAKKDINDTVKLVREQLRPAVIFDKNGNIISNLGAMTYISKISVVKGKNNAISKIIVSCSELLQKAPMLEALDGGYYVASERGKNNDWIFKFVSIEYYVAPEPPKSPRDRFRLEILQ